jgi:hypothetical protein
MARKAQIKMFETVAVLIVFFFLLGIGLTIYGGSQRAELSKLKARQFELTAVQTAARSMAFPELDCSTAAVRTSDCFDRRKLDAFSALAREDPAALLAYTEVFGYANITVREVYPGTATWSLFTSLPPREAQGSVELVQLPVLLADPVEKRHAFGVLEVRVYGLA